MSKIMVEPAYGDDDEYVDTDDVKYDFVVGEGNGCLTIIAKTEGNPDGVITVSDKEDVVRVYSQLDWGQVYRE